MTENKKFKQVLFAFKMYYMFYLLLAFNAFVNGTVVMKYATMAAAVWGAALGLWMLLDYKRYLKVPNLWAIVAFIASAVLSAILNIRYGYIDNIQGLIWMGISLIVIYVPTCTYSKAEVLKELKITAVAYVIYCTAVHIFSVSMVFWGRNMGYVDPQGMEHIVGFNWGRLWGIYDEPNRGSIMALAAIFFAVYLFWNAKKCLGKVFWILCIIAQYLFLIFSDSRTGELGLAAGLFVLVGLWTRYKLDKKKYRIIPAVIIAFIVAISALAGTMGCKQLYNSVDNKLEALIKGDNKEANKETKPKSDNNTAIGRKADLEKDISNGRFGIWESGLEIIKASPIYGVSQRNITEFAMDHFPDTYLVNNPLEIKYDSMHSMLVDVAASQGLIGIAVLIWLIFGTFMYLKNNAKTLTLEHFKPAMILFAILAMITAASLVITTIFYVNSPETYCFWLCFGYFMAILRSEQKEKEA